MRKRIPRMMATILVLILLQAAATIAVIPALSTIIPSVSAQTSPDLQLTHDSSSDNIRLSWSSNGSLIAFSKLPLPPACCQSKIWVMNSDGSGQRQLSSGTLDDSPNFSLDGSNITFNRWPSSRGDYSEIMTMKSNGCCVHQVTNDSASITYEYPSYSPGGNQVAYTVLVGTTAAPNPHHFWVYTIKPDGTGETNLTKGMMPVFTPDSLKVVYVIADPEVSNDTIAMYSKDIHGTPVTTRITSGPFDFFPRVFPNGTKIAFARCAQLYQHCDIYSVNIDGTGLRQLTFDGNTQTNLYPAISPDGAKITYASNRTGSFQIWVMSLPTSTTTSLAAFPNAFQLIAMITAVTAIFSSGTSGYLLAKLRRLSK